MNYYDRRKSLNLCTKCGKNSSIGILCDSCKKSERLRIKRFKSHRKSLGLCQCGQKLSSAVLCDACRAKSMLRMKKFRRSNKDKIIQHYGGKCACCGEKIVQFLTVDHVNGGGNKHRNIENGSINSWLIKNNYPNGFRLLCFNCNFLKHYESLPKNAATQRQRRLKSAVFMAYGGKCICCGNDNHTVLTIDHKKGGGRQARTAFGYTSQKWYKWLQAHNYPNDYQLLCLNCNCGKSINTYYSGSDICPHQNSGPTSWCDALKLNQEAEALIVAH